MTHCKENAKSTVIAKAKIPISRLEQMRVGPKFMIIDMVTSVFYRDLEQGEQNERCSALDCWLRAACNASTEHKEDELTENESTTNEPRDVSNHRKVYPDKETPLTEYEPTDITQHDMKLSTLFEFRTTRAARTGFEGGKSDILIVDMVAVETAQQLAGRMYELVINADKKRQRREHELPSRRRESSKPSKLETIIYAVLRATAQQLTDGEHISVNDAELSRQREEFLDATTRGEFQDFANTIKIEKYAYEATMRMLRDHRAQDIRLGGLHYMCISHVLSPRQCDEAEALAAGVHNAVHATRQLIAMTNLSPSTHQLARRTCND